MRRIETEKTFLSNFREHVKKMREVKSYRAMLRNLRNPDSLSGEWCPFGGRRGEDYFIINEAGKVVRSGRSRGVGKYFQAVEYWEEHRYDPDLVRKMIEVIKEMREEEDGKATTHKGRRK